jgi:hypothetical protein
MKAKENTKKQLVRTSKSNALSLAAAKLKDRILFPEKIETAKKYLQNADISALK